MVGTDNSVGTGVIDRRPQWWPVLLAGCFIFWHLLYFIAGLRFDSGTLDGAWQFIDPVLLREDLFRSLLYYHAQPPGFNLFLGLVVKVFPTAHDAAFHIAFLVLAFGLYVTLFLLLRDMGLGPWAAFGLATLWCASPAVALYENWLFYTFPVCAFLVFSAWFLSRYLRTFQWGWLAGFLACLVLIHSMRSLFHWIHLVGVVLVLLPFVWPRRRAFLIGAGIALLLLLPLYIKNQVLFGQFGTSSWLGMSLYRVVTKHVPSRDLEPHVNTGDVSPLVKVRSFPSRGNLPEGYVPRESPYDVPVLTEWTRSTGAPNYNHFAYLDISHNYREDALFLAPRYPGFVALGLAGNMSFYFRSPVPYSLLDDNATAIHPALPIYEGIFYGRLPFDGTCWLFIVLFPLVLILGLRDGIRARFRDPALAGLLIYLVFNILYVFAVGTILESGENFRFRFLTEPLGLVVFGHLALAVWHKRHPLPLKAPKPALPASMPPLACNPWR